MNLGIPPQVVMDTMTASQIGLVGNFAEKKDLRFAENQAAIIWRMATGKYKPMTENKEVRGKKAIEQLEKIFGIEDE